MAEEPVLSRRDLLRGRLRGALAGAALNEAPRSRSAPARRMALPIHRPPGAVDEPTFLADCTRCGDCIPACPVNAIVIAPGRFRDAAGTPIIDPYTSACVMCDDAPCVKACRPGVLRADLPRKMGVAWIQTMACLAHTGSFCSVCFERCPVPGSIELHAGKPAIRAEVCTGCGVCANVCPAPENAIVVMPLAERPKPCAGPESRGPSVRA